MDIRTWDSRVLGAVFDLTLRHAPDGVRILDHVKQALIKYVRDVFEDDDVFYLYHPDIIESMTKVGQEVSSIANYESDGWEFDLNFALTQTLYVLDAEHFDFQKKLFLFTDRFNPRPIQKVVKLRDKDMIDCDVVVFSICQTDHSLEGVTIIPVKDVLTLSDHI